MKALSPRCQQFDENLKPPFSILGKSNISLKYRKIYHKPFPGIEAVQIPVFTFSILSSNKSGSLYLILCGSSTE